MTSKLEPFPAFKDILMSTEESSQLLSDFIFEQTGRRFHGVRMVNSGTEILGIKSTPVTFVGIKDE